MIKLEVKDFCHTCPLFEADVEGPILSTLHFADKTEQLVSDVVIKCSHRDACYRIEKYLKGEE